MGRENVSISLFWADPVELWMKLNHGEKSNALVFLLSFLPSPLSLQYYGFLLYCTDEGPSTWTVKSHLLSESCLRSSLNSPFSLMTKFSCHRMKSTKSSSTWLYRHFGSQKYWSPGVQIIPLKTISMGFTASFLSSSVQPNNKLRCMNCVYCIELEPLS